MTTRPAPPSRWSNRTILHLCTVSLSILAFTLVQLEVPDPYLDEIFHIPQTQRYCDEDFEYWDPAITTPPGLYLFSAIPLMTVHVPCTVPRLRSTNLLFSTFIIPGLMSALLEPKPIQPIWRHFVRPSVEAMVISTFPLISFFSNLYYTDVASLAGVLGCLGLAKRGRHWAAVLVGVWSMTVRQTNVIWVAFTLAVCLLDEASRSSYKKLDDRPDGDRNVDCLLGEVQGPAQVVTLALNTCRILLHRWRIVRWVVLPYLLPFGGFLVFLRWNGGIVLGHKDQHEVAIHLPQLLYFLALATVLLLPALLAEGILPLIRGSLSTGLGTVPRSLASLLSLTGMIVTIRSFTIWHPFLLADNRHYIFYLLRRVFLPYSMAKYAVAPLYLAASWVWLWRLRRSATVLWTLAYVGCTFLVLVPSPLIEPRYFLIPTILLRLQLTSSSTQPSPSLAPRWRLEYVWYALINAATIGLFLVKKFRWEGWEGWMRFMW